MSSEQLADGVNPLDAELAATWDVLKGYSGRDTDLGIARRFGGADAAYSLRDIGAMNGRVVKARRDVDGQGSDPEEDFSANQVQDGTLERWVNGELESTLPANVATAAAAYSLRKVNSDYGIPTTVVNGTENFPATVPSSGSPADIGNGFTVHRFSDGVADSESVTVSGGTIIVTAIASGTGTFSGGCRIKGLSDNKQYTVSGEFRVTSQGADGDALALVDISDDTAGTDEDSITTASTTFTPFFIDAGYNSGVSYNFVDLQANSNGSNSGTITAEFRNIKIIENNNSAVRIRRSSDDEEVVVGFDSDNKVSASSPVTATPSGSTTATDLNGFLNESVSGFTSVPYSGIDSSYKNFTSDPTISDTAFSGTNGGTQSRLVYLNTTDAFVTASDFNGCKVKVTGTVNTLSGGNITVKPNTQTDGGGSWTPSEGDKVLSTIGSFEYIFTGDGINGFRSVVFVIDASTTVNVSNLTFEYIEHGATVHTWYDQAGINNAVQETAANQPKIAENGALLADGIDFDGSNDNLTLGDICDNINNFSAFMFAKSDGATGGTQICWSQGASGDSNIFYQGRNDANVVFGYVATANTTTSTVSQFQNGFLFTSIAGSSTAKSFGNAVESVSVSSSSSNPSSDSNTIGSHFSSNYFDGSIQELVFFNSDQSDNRFKIESNINNYYGLYNDANDTSGVFAESGLSGGTFENATNEGFDCTTGVNNQVFVNLDLALDGVANDSSYKYYISFNADVDYNGGTTTLVALTNDSGSVATTGYSVVNGFNSQTLTANQAGVTPQKIRFQIRNTASVTKTVNISDFKISRIARNGFVETWYDQSGNSRDMEQDTAAYQPAIVKNANICKTANGYETISFDGSDDYLVALGYSPAADSEGGMTDFNLTCVTGTPPTSSLEAVASMGSQEGSNAIGGFYFSNNLNSGDSTKQDIRFYISEHDASPHIDQKVINAAILNDTNLLSFNRRGSDNTFELFDPDGTKLTGTSLIPKCGQTGENDDFKVGAAMFNNASQREYQGDILEVMLFDSSDKRDDAPTINSEIEHYYNI